MTSDTTMDNVPHKFQSYNIYKDFFDNAPVMYLSICIATKKITQCNNALLKRLGYLEVELLGELFLKIYHPNCYAKAKYKFKYFLNTKSLHDVEMTLVSKSGEKVDVLLNASAISDSEGNIVASRSMLTDITPFKSTHHQFHRTLVETIPYGIEECDTQGMITFANPAHERLYDEGSGAGGLIGRYIWQQSACEKDKLELQKYLKYLVAEQPTPVPYFSKWQTKTGRLIDVRVDWNYKRDKDQNLLGFVSVITDISKQKQTEMEAENNTLELQTIINSTPYGIAIFNKDMTVRWANNQIAAMFDLIVEDMIGKCWYDLVPVMKKREDIYSRVLQGESLSLYDINLEIDGKHRSFEAHYNPVPDCHGDTMGMVIAATDTTQRKQAEISLRTSEEQYRIISVLSPVGICHINANGDTVLFANQCLSEFTGLDNARLKKEGWMAAIHPEDIGRVRLEWHKANEQQAFFKSEFRFQHQDENVVWVLAQAQVETDESNQSICYVCTFTNVTKQHETELKLRKQQWELTHFARINTVGELMSGIAHELNQPLTAITHFVGGCIARKEEENISQEMIEMMEKIEAQAARAGGIIRHLRNFLRKNDFDRTDVDINLVIRNAVKLLEHNLHHDKVSLELDLTSDTLILQAAATQLEQVIINLIQNAIEAMALQKSKKQIIVTSRLSNGNICISVSDNGPGVLENDLRRIFFPFFTTKSEGMGIGLSISKTIIEMYEGEICVALNQSGGCDVNVTLPLNESICCAMTHQT